MRKNTDISSSLFSERLTALRRRQGLSRREVADAIGVSNRAYTNWETGKQTKAMEFNILRIAEFFDVDFDYLVGVSDEPRSSARPAHSPNSTLDPAPESYRPDITRAPGHGRRWRIVAAIFGLVAVVVVIALVAFRREQVRTAMIYFEDNRVVVRDDVLGARMWSQTHHSKIRVAKIIDIGDGERIAVYGLSGDFPDSGWLMARSVSNGKLLWDDRPDLEGAVRAFGSIGGDAAGYGVRRIESVDIDGDGTREIVVVFGHNLWYPNYIRLYRSDGEIVDTYYICGAVEDILPVDIDRDGKDEVLVATTNNGKAYQGAQILLLDNRHFHGASRDSLMLSDTTLPDSCAIRVIFSCWERRFVELCGSGGDGARLHARHIQVHFTREGNAQVTISIALNERLLSMTLDSELRPLNVSPTDGFLRYMNEWPAADRERFLDTLDDWMARHYRYGAKETPPPGPGTAPASNRTDSIPVIATPGRML